jgi:hypothetical protein
MQELLTQSLNDLESLRHQISELSLFSPNEVFEDISTTDIVYLFVPYIFSEVQSRLRSTGKTARMNTIVQTEVRAYLLNELPYLQLILLKFAELSQILHFVSRKL